MYQQEAGKERAQSHVRSQPVNNLVEEKSDDSFSAGKESVAAVNAQAMPNESSTRDNVSVSALRAMVSGTPDEFKCSITHEIMLHPVILLDDGHSYERTAIEGYIEQSARPVSPMTGEPLVLKMIQSNFNLKKAIDAFRQNHPDLDAWLKKINTESHTIQRIESSINACVAREIDREQNEEAQAKGRRQSSFITYQQNLKTYLQQRQLLGQHTGENNYDVFISYAWEEHNKQAHEKLQGFLDRIHDDLQAIGLKVFLDIRDMNGDMNTAMESITGSGITLSIIRPFLNQRLQQDPGGNIALEIRHLSARMAENSQSVLPLLCEGQWDTDLPEPIRNQLSQVSRQAPACGQDIRQLFLGFNPDPYRQDTQFSYPYMEWFTSTLVPRILTNLGVAEGDLLLATLTQLFLSQIKQQQLPNIHQMSESEQLKHNQHLDRAEEDKEDHGEQHRLQSFEFLLGRLKELNAYRQEAAITKTVLLAYQMPDSGSSEAQDLGKWIRQFASHLSLCGMEVQHWSEGPLTQPIPPAVIIIATPLLKKTAEEGLKQRGSVWLQLREHLMQPQVNCCPIVYQGDRRSAVPKWSEDYPQWKKSFFTRNARGGSLEVSGSRYMDLMVRSDKSSGLLLELLKFDDNDPCYLWLLKNLQYMLLGWGTQDLLKLEENMRLEHNRKQESDDAKQEVPHRPPYRRSSLFSTPRPHPDEILRERLPEFLKAVVSGQQETVNDLLTQYPALALIQVQVDDLSTLRCLEPGDEGSRSFPVLSGIEYAVWGSDEHMLNAMLAHLKEDPALLESAIAQCNHVLQHGVQVCRVVSGVKTVEDRSTGFDERPLIEAILSFTDHCNQWPYDTCKVHLRDVIGKEARKLPVHIIQEICRPDRALHPLTDSTFRELTLPRDGTLDEKQTLRGVAWWFEHSGQDSGLALYRAGGGMPKSVTEIPAWKELALQERRAQQFWLKLLADLLYYDATALNCLFTIRRAQIVQRIREMTAQASALSSSVSVPNLQPASQQDTNSDSEEAKSDTPPLAQALRAEVRSDAQRTRVDAVSVAAMRSSPRTIIFSHNSAAQNQEEEASAMESSAAFELTGDSPDPQSTSEKQENAFSIT